MLLNCDLGEGAGRHEQDLEAAVMPYIDQANIACGVHAGDKRLMLHTLGLACQHNVSIGAHPSYPDRQGFGRRSMKLPRHELVSVIQAQLATLGGLAKEVGTQLDYVKPHGALYNDMMRHESVMEAVMEAVSGDRNVSCLMIQASPSAAAYRETARQYHLTLFFEAFADRAYGEDGLLVPRDQAAAVHTLEQTLAQARQLMQGAAVTTIAGNTIAVQADTLCVHGDSRDALQAATMIRALCPHAD